MSLGGIRFGFPGVCGPIMLLPFFEGCRVPITLLFVFRDPITSLFLLSGEMILLFDFNVPIMLPVFKDPMLLLFEFSGEMMLLFDFNVPIMLLPVFSVPITGFGVLLEG